MVAFIVPRTLAAVKVNNASLRQLPAVLQAAADGRANLELPESHPRAAYWQAAQARNAEDWETVLALMKPRVEAGDRYAQQFVGLAYESQGNYLRAAEVWQQVGNAAALIRVAEGAARAEQDSVALRAFSAAWEIDPRNGTSPYADFLGQTGDLIAAERVLRAGLAKAPPYWRTIPYWHQRLARLLMEQERWREAAAAWEEVVRTAHLFYSPGSRMGDVYYGMARAYHMSGQQDKAVVAIERAVEEEPKMSYFMRAGQIYEAAGNVERAVDAYRQVLAADPNHRPAQEAIERLGSGP